MKIYFIKATFNGKVYRISDFYNIDDSYRLNNNRMFELNITANDLLTSVAVPSNKLQDNSSVLDYTHIIVPEVDKVYEITKSLFLNKNQVRLELREDVFISNYQELKTKRLVIGRSNDINNFIGIHDVKEVNTLKTSQTLIPNTNAEYNSKTGIWALVFVQNDFNPNTDWNFLRGSFGEKFETLNDVKVKYPEVSTTTPNRIEYNLKNVIVENGIIDKEYQCLWNPVLNKMEWREFGESIPVMRSNSYKLFSSSVSDINLAVFAFPLRKDIYMVNSSLQEKRIPSFYDFSSMTSPQSILDIKFIDDSFFENLTYNFNSGKMIINSDSLENITTFQGETELDWNLVSLLFLKNDIDISYPLTTNIFSYMPFKKYYLQFFGERFLINPNYINKLRLYTNITYGTVNYVLYHGNKQNIIASGSFAHSGRWSADRLDLFYQQNPTYKDMFNTRQMLKGINGVTGSLTSFASGNNLAGTSNLFGTGVQLVGNQAMNELKLSGMSMQPDQINGDNSEIGIQFNTLFGIFWIEESVVEGIDEMLNSYEINGFPTLQYKTINELVERDNDIYGECKIVQGYLVQTIKNNYITNELNKILKEGVVII